MKKKKRIHTVTVLLGPAALTYKDMAFVELSEELDSTVVCRVYEDGRDATKLKQFFPIVGPVVPFVFLSDDKNYLDNICTDEHRGRLRIIKEIYRYLEHKNMESDEEMALLTTLIKHFKLKSYTAGSRSFWRTKLQDEIEQLIKLCCTPSVEMDKCLIRYYRFTHKKFVTHFINGVTKYISNDVYKRIEKDIQTMWGKEDPVPEEFIREYLLYTDLESLYNIRFSDSAARVFDLSLPRLNIEEIEARRIEMRILKVDFLKRLRISFKYYKRLQENPHLIRLDFVWRIAKILHCSITDLISNY